VPTTLSCAVVRCNTLAFLKQLSNFSHGISFINYFPLFINATDPEEIIVHYFIKGDVHWNEKGHALIAQELITQLNN